MSKDYLELLKKQGLDYNLNNNAEEKLRDFINKLFSQFNFNLTKKASFLTQNNNKYLLDVSKKSIYIVPNCYNKNIQMWSINFLANKKECEQIQINYLQKSEDAAIKYISLLFDFNKDIILRANLYYFDSDNTSLIKNTENKRSDINNLIKKQKTFKNNQILNNIQNINQKYLPLADLSIHINCSWKKYNLIEPKFLVESNKNKNTMLINYLNNNLQNLLTDDIYTIYSNYCQVMEEKIKPLVTKQKLRTINKCA